jgi:hypothetical protein
MKRMKKLLAMLLTVTMTCALSVTPALARDETSGGDSGTTSTEGSSGGDSGTTSTEGSSQGSEGSTDTSGFSSTGIHQLKFVKILKAAAGSAVTNETFTFTMTPATQADIDKATAAGNTASYTVHPGLGSGLTATVQTNQGVTPDVATTLSDYDTTGVEYTTYFNLDDIDFSDAATGVYRYNVVETNERTDYMTVGGEQFTVDLYVDQDHKVIYTVAMNSAYQKEPIVFTNTLQTTNVTIEKKVTGNMLTTADQTTKEFTFKMQIPEGGDTLYLSEGATFSYTKYDKNGQIGTGTITVRGDKKDDPSTYTNEFTLKNGEKIVFNNIPNKMIFACYEVEDSDFSVSYNYKVGNLDENVAQNSKGRYFESGAADNVLTFTNTKIDKVDSGIILDIMPYIAVILIVAAAGVTTILAKRRRITK